MHRDTGVLPPLQYGMFDGRWATQIGQQRRMDVQAAVLRIVEDPRWDKEAEGHGDDDIYGVGWRPACEGVDHMSR